MNIWMEGTIKQRFLSTYSVPMPGTVLSPLLNETHLIPTVTPRGGRIVIPISRVKKTELRVAKQLVRGLTTDKLRGGDLNPATWWRSVVVTAPPGLFFPRC